ncbi:hypothetical protein IT408_04840 [Candidatus Uhrbacteria bacterium]|nr:hypothetical protein [Candidatus Uhrbacteria bacterium]
MENIQKRYLFGSGVLALFFAHNFIQSVEQKKPLLITMLLGYVSSRILGLIWRHLSNQDLIAEFSKNIPDDIRSSSRFKIFFLNIMHHERSFWIGWCNAMCYAFVLMATPIIPLAFMAGFTLYALWHHYKLTEIKEFVQRMEIHGWEKLDTLTSDPFLKEIDP